MAKIVLLNGPAKVGKDEVVKHLLRSGIPLGLAECKENLYKLVQILFGLSEERFFEIYNDRCVKEIEMPEFTVRFGNSWEQEQMEAITGQSMRGYHSDPMRVQLSVREAMIYVSECVVKPRFGQDYFGRTRVANMVTNKGCEFFVDPSAGFLEELPPTVKLLGQDNILLIRIHRNGHNFEGDSRDWIPDGVINNTVDVYNNGTIEDFFLQTEHIVRRFLYNAK